MSDNTYVPPPEPDDGASTPDGWGSPRTPHAGTSRSGVARLFSAAWWLRARTWFGKLLRGRRTGDRLAPPRPEPSMPDLLSVHEPQDTFTLETPAQGDGFNFHVQVRCSWCVQAIAPEEEKERRTAEIRTFIAENRPTILERIEDTIRPLAREFPPYRAAEAEVKINKGLVGCLSDGDVKVTVVARVNVCEPVREDLQTVWRERLVLDCNGDFRKAQVDLLDELQEKWRKLLIEGLEGIGEVQTAKAAWIAPYALALAQDPQQSAAEHLQTLVEHRVSHAEKLLANLSRLVVDERIEELEFAFQSDSALRAVLTYLGVPVPEPHGDAQEAAGFKGAENA